MNDMPYAPFHQLRYCVKKWERHPEVGDGCCVIKAEIYGETEELVCQKNDYGLAELPDFTLHSKMFPFAIGKWVPKYRVSDLGIRRIENENVPVRATSCTIISIHEIEEISSRKTMLPKWYKRVPLPTQSGTNIPFQYCYGDVWCNGTYQSGTYGRDAYGDSQGHDPGAFIKDERGCAQHYNRIRRLIDGVWHYYGVDWQQFQEIELVTWCLSKGLNYQTGLPISSPKTMTDTKKADQNQWDVSMSKTFDEADVHVVIEKDKIKYGETDFYPKEFSVDLSARLSVKAKYEKEFGKIRK